MKKADQLTINLQELRHGDRALRTLTNPVSRQILQLLHDRGQACVSEVYQALSLRQSDTSRHLSELRHAGLVSANPRGQFIYYAVHYVKLQRVNSGVAELLHFRPGNKVVRACVPCTYGLIPVSRKRRNIKPPITSLSVPLSENWQVLPCILFPVNFPSGLLEGMVKRS
ncbi:metalloregulator ArsR/SmtB family transcription factor [Paraflavisolibacter sp. H34]|uniref:ArsR/SmtB family transcription factor n=1 Tax=Huijunlia imazamoxiresistens TaxID=3127457 RepID=UPI0030179F37